jgi:GNAT superfamily N-acetyltransferase
MIRAAAEADSQLVRELSHAFNAEVADLPWREDDEDVLAPDVSLLAGEDGIVSLRRDGSRCFVVDVLYVRPAARGKGLGMELMRAAAEHARTAGAEAVELTVLESNKAARRLYEHLGYATVERRLAAMLTVQGDDATYGAVHVQTDDADLVRREAAKVLHTEPDVTHAGNWVRVDADVEKLRTLARELSYASGVAIALSVESGNVVRYVLFDRGSMVDEYASVPEFHGPLPPGDVVALGANATVVARLTGADPRRVREVARTAASPSELPPAAELYVQIADLLGVKTN